MKIIAVTSCATGIAHSYMAAEAITKAVRTAGHEVKVEIQGAMGVEHRLTAADVADASLIIFSNDVGVGDADRFEGAAAPTVRIAPHEVIRHPEKVLEAIDSVAVKTEERS